MQWRKISDNNSKDGVINKWNGETSEQLKNWPMFQLQTCNIWKKNGRMSNAQELFGTIWTHNCQCQGAGPPEQISNI